MQDTLYPATLLAGLVSAGVAVALGLLHRLGRGSRRLSSFSRGATALGALLLLASVGVHGALGHGPTALEPMGPGRFAAEHPVYLAGAALLGVAWWLGRRRRP